MKKSLVLAMAMALGVTASAYAANPFSDVPAGHWAYDSISKLAAAGVIEGYEDDTFRGDRLMTRYEIAQIVARAMAKGANTDKLAAEFADELDAMGVRIAALEKKSDNVRVAGEVYYYWAAKRGNAFPTGTPDKVEHGLRSRLYFNGKINDNWTYAGRIENRQFFRDDVGNEGTEFNVAKVEGRLGGVIIVAGRDDDEFANGYIYDGEHDALKLFYGDKWYIKGAYGKLTEANENDAFFPNAINPVTTPAVSKKFCHFEAGSKMDTAVNGKAGYLRADTTDIARAWINDKNIGIWYVGADFKMGEDFGLNAMYLRSNVHGIAGVNNLSKKSGYVFGLTYKGAEEDKPGSWGLNANYYNQGRFTYLLHTIDGHTDFNSGFRGWSIGGDVTIAKNMVLSATYYDTKALKRWFDADADHVKIIWTECNITF